MRMPVFSFYESRSEINRALLSAAAKKTRGTKLEHFHCSVKFGAEKLKAEERSAKETDAKVRNAETVLLEKTLTVLHETRAGARGSEGKFIPGSGISIKMLNFETILQTCYKETFRSRPCLSRRAS